MGDRGERDDENVNTELEPLPAQVQDVNTIVEDDNEVLSDIGSQSSWAVGGTHGSAKPLKCIYEDFSDYDEFGSGVSDSSDDEGEVNRTKHELSNVLSALEEQTSQSKSVANQMFWDYKKVLRKALAELLLHYNAESIHTLLFHVKDVHRYLEFAPRMSELHHLHLQQDDDLPREHLEHTLEFIRRHRSAFQGRNSLNLMLGQGWKYFDSSIFHDDARKKAWSKPAMELYLSNLEGSSHSVL